MEIGTTCDIFIELATLLRISNEELKLCYYFKLERYFMIVLNSNPKLLFQSDLCAEICVMK